MKKLRHLTAKQLRDVGRVFYDALEMIRIHHTNCQLYSDLIITGKTEPRFHDTLSRENSNLMSLTWILYRVFDIAFSINDRHCFYQTPELLSLILDKYLVADRIAPSVEAVTIDLASELEGTYTSSVLFVGLVQYLAASSILLDPSREEISLIIRENIREDPKTIVISTVVHTEACELEEPEGIFDQLAYTMDFHEKITGLEPTAAKVIAWRLGGEVHCERMENEVRITATIPHSNVIE